MYGYIYMVINLLNNKKYIGKRQWFNESTIEKDKYLGSGKLLKQSFKKYGKENFEKRVLFICYSEDELNSKEVEFINSYNAIQSKEFYNIHEGGKGGNTKKGYTDEEMKLFGEKIKESKAKNPYKHSEETKTKIKNIMLSKENHMKLPKYRKMFSEMFKGSNNHSYGKKLSEEQKKKLLDSHNGFFAYNKGTKLSDERRKIISENSKAMWQNQEFKERMISERIGKTRSESAKVRMSQAAYKRYNSINMNEDIFIYKCDENFNIIETYDGINSYYEKYKTKTHRNLKNAIQNKNKFKGFYWKIKYKSLSTIETTSLYDGKE